MTDPLDVLRSPVSPVAPDPAFVTRLRARLVDALTPDPEGAPMASAAAEPILTPYLAVADARRALDWYQSSLGFRLRGDPIVMDDGRIGHAELELGAGPVLGVVMLADEFPEIGAVAPSTDPSAGVHFLVHTTVADVDAATRRAVDGGAVLERAPADYPHGRTATIRDPFGHRWMLSSPVAASPAVSYRPRHGDLVYVSLWLGDVDRAAAFYASVLGWRYAPADDPRSLQVEGQSLPHGLWGGQQHHTMFLAVAVDDLDAAVARVRANGGTAEDAHEEPYGLTSRCRDDQGMPFSLHQTSPSAGGRGPVNGERHGDVGYVTLEVVDSSRSRAFFGAVLGWRFSPGHVEDGWGVDDTVPMIGLHGGHDVATVVPMYRVDDVVAAVARVRAAGGTSTDPEHQPYGISAECTDDQGTRFYLGELTTSQGGPTARR